MEPREHARRVITVLAGRAAVYEPGPRGHGLTLSVAEAATVVGLAGLSERARGLRVVATMPSLLCLVAFEEVARRNPEVGLRLVRVLGERIGVLEARLAELAYGGYGPPGGRHLAADGGRRGDGTPKRQAPYPLYPPAAGEHDRGQPGGRHQGDGEAAPWRDHRGQGAPHSRRGHRGLEASGPAGVADRDPCSPSLVEG